MHTTETIFFWLALGLYSLGWLLLVAGANFRKPTLEKRGVQIAVLALLAHTACILTRWIVTGHGPVMRDYENALAGSWVIAGLSLLLARKDKLTRPLLLVAIPAALVLLGYGVTRDAELEPLSPALKTPWLYVHVIFAWISFGAFSAASCTALVFLIKGRRGGNADEASLEMLDELQFRLITYGFVAAAVMIASGAIWARLLWGSYWGWDPVETWSLASWLVYGLYIHFRLIFGWRMRRAAWFALFAVFPVIYSFWAVGSLMTSRHIFSIMDMLNK